MSNAANQQTILNAVLTLVNALEADAAAWKTGDNQIDQNFLNLLSQDTHVWYSAILQFGSRSQQQQAAQARAAASGGAAASIDATYTALDLYVRQINSQLSDLANPTAQRRRNFVNLN